jgi:hypothetical protein
MAFVQVSGVGFEELLRKTPPAYLVPGLEMETRSSAMVSLIPGLELTWITVTQPWYRMPTLLVI